jgi:hypothetical protein
MYSTDKILVLHYYKSIVDGVMTSLIDTFFNIRNETSTDMRIICPELYSLDHDDYYDFNIDETQPHIYKDDIGVDTEPYEGEYNDVNFGFMRFKNKATSSVPFLRFNRNFGDYNLLYTIDQDNHKFKADIVICSGRLIYEILNGAKIEIECNKLIVLDSLDTYKSRIGMFPDFDDLFSTMFKNSDVIQLSNPATMRESKYKQIEYYHKFSKKRLNALKQTGLLKDEYIFDRTKKEKTMITEGAHFENMGKGIFEHLWFDKHVYYKSDGLFDKDGLYYYLKLFDIDATKDQEISIQKYDLKNKLFWRENEIYI